MSSDIKDIFKSVITGGNAYETKLELNAIDDLIKTNMETSLKAVSKAIYSSPLKTSLNCYNEWWLLNFMTDYFANIVDFKFKNYKVNRAAMLAIRMGVMFGAGAVLKVNNKYVPLYISEVITDEYGEPIKIKYNRADYMLINQAYSEYDLTKGIQEMEINENLILFMPDNVQIGGLIKWQPFLKQFSNLLKMLYTHSFSYVKSVLYNISDPTAITEEINLYFNLENPFLINTSDDAILQNKFKEFKINAASGSNDLINYINEFLKIYYDLLGRRYNTDKKKERNLTGEVDASQENFDILQRALRLNIEYFIEEIKDKFNENFTLKSEKMQQEEEEANNIAEPSKVSQKAPKQQKKEGS